MRGDSHADHDDCHSGCCNKSSQAKPVSRPLETSRFLADLSYYVACGERRETGLGNAAQNIPQLFVILRFHCLLSIELLAASEVAPEKVLKIDTIFLELQENLLAVEYELGGAFCARLLLRSGESARE